MTGAEKGRAGLNKALQVARDQVWQLERQVAAATCAEVGHDWQFFGGRNCGCIDSDCSIPVYACRKCGDCDYGDNAEATAIKVKCDAALSRSAEESHGR